jgi:ribonuclease HII
MNQNNIIIENTKKKNKVISSLKSSFQQYKFFEIGIDEAGRGPMFGRVYASAVVLPKDNTFNHYWMKDSKNFHSKNKIQEVANYIKENAIAWAIEYEDENVIDKINILQATQSAMHKAIAKVTNQLILKSSTLLSDKINNDIYDNILLLIDGNYFNPYIPSLTSKSLSYELIEGGDNKYSSIAAASILAKVARDQYIEDLCDEYPDLIEKYAINTNKGYGSKKHMDGILQHGITQWHRKTFGICKTFSSTT